MTTINGTILVAAFAVLAACGGADVEQSADTDTAEPESGAPAVTFTPEETREIVAKPTGPVTVAYRVIGQPVVGQPVAIDLEISSAIGSRPISVSYRINDATAMELAPSQPERSAVLLSDDQEYSTQQVMVVPRREGRLFLNVAADVETDGGTISTVTAVPIQVGTAPRAPEQNGTVTTDENGEQIRVLPAGET